MLTWPTVWVSSAVPSTRLEMSTSPSSWADALLVFLTSNHSLPASAPAGLAMISVMTRSPAAKLPTQVPFDWPSCPPALEQATRTRRGRNRFMNQLPEQKSPHGSRRVMRLLAIWRLLVQPEHVAARIAETGRDLGGIGAHGLHDLAAGGGDLVDRGLDLIDHDVDEESGARHGRAPGDPGAADLAEAVVEGE